MVVFSLLIYSCITLNGWRGELLQKTCAWKTEGSLYSTEKACLKAAPSLNSPIFSDVSDGRKVEAVECREQKVYE